MTLHAHSLVSGLNAGNTEQVADAYAAWSERGRIHPEVEPKPKNGFLPPPVPANEGEGAQVDLA